MNNAERRAIGCQNFTTLLINDGYRLLGEYVNSKTKVRVVCNNGHDVLVRPGDFVQGCKCGLCRNNTVKRDEAFLKFSDYVISERCTLKDEYINSHTNVTIECEQGHSFDVRPSNFRKMKGCKICNLESVQVSSNFANYGNVFNQKRAISRFKQAVESMGYRCVGSYISYSTPVSVICSKGHAFSITPHSINKGRRCSECVGNEYYNNKAKTEFEGVVSSRGYIMLSEYTTCMKKIEMECPNGHRCRISPNSFKKGSGCSSCSKTGYDFNKTGYLYVLRHKEGENWYKVGISNNYTKRISCLRRTTPFDFDVLAVWTGDGREVYKCEQSIHKNFEPAGLSGFNGSTEWLVADGSILELPSSLGLRPLHPVVRI